MTIGKIISGRGAVVTCRSDILVMDAVELLSEKRIGAMPVIGAEGSIEGIFSERDVIRCLRLKGAGALQDPVSQAMTAPAITVNPGTAIDEALALMTRRRFRHLPVVEDGRMIGIVSIGDLVKYRMDAIESEAEAMRSYIRSA